MAHLKALVISLMLAGQLPAPATAEDKAASAAAHLTGNWEVSLFYSADAPPSSTLMTIDAVSEDGVLSGSFYGTPFAAISRATERGGVIVFTAVTADNSGNYVHSGRLQDGVIEGQTLSEGRGFLMTWQAERATPQDAD